MEIGEIVVDIQCRSLTWFLLTRELGLGGTVPNILPGVKDGNFWWQTLQQNSQSRNVKECRKSKTTPISIDLYLTNYTLVLAVTG